MCLVTKQTEPLIAENDIECYKVLVLDRGELKSPIKHFLFTLNTLYTDQIPEHILLDMWGSTLIDAGFFHAFSAYPNKKILSKEDIVFKAIIPKGTIYYKGSFHNDICAKSIKIIKECD